MKELKGAYDAAQQQDSPSLYEEEPDDGSPSDETGASNLSTLADSRGDDLVDHLDHEVNDDEPTDQALPEKISTVLNNILASGLNETSINKTKRGRETARKLQSFACYQSKLRDLGHRAKDYSQHGC